MLNELVTNNECLNQWSGESGQNVTMQVTELQLDQRKDTRCEDGHEDFTDNGLQ